MNKETQSIVVALLGGLLISITLSHRFTSYVRPGFAPLLLIGGGILVLVGVVSLILAIRADATKERGRATHKAAEGAPVVQAGAGDGPTATTPSVVATAAPDQPDHIDQEDPGVHGHPHDHDKSKAPWLILIPVLVLLLVAPPALGADAVARNASSQALAGVDVVAREGSTSKDGAGGGGGYKFNDGSGSAADSTGSRRTMHFPALPAGADPSIGMKDLILRALYDADNSVEGVPVTVTGFIAPAGDGYTDGYTVARIVISCCAADANPMQLHIAADAPFPANTWVDAVVTVVPNTATMDNGYVPTVTVTSMTPVPQPDDPYEH
jgi:uncharacterized repeat protein (TIGR03943 family)